MKLWNVALSLFSQADARRFVLNLLIAFMPLAVLGAAVRGRHQGVLFAPVPVALALVVGGVLILWAEKRKHVERIPTVDDIGPLGCAQGGPVSGARADPRHEPLGGDDSRRPVHRHEPARGDGVLVLHRDPDAARRDGLRAVESAGHDHAAEAAPLAISSVVAFISALLSIRFLLRFVSRHSFAVFAWYRIVFGGMILATWAVRMGEVVSRATSGVAQVLHREARERLVESARQRHRLEGFAHLARHQQLTRFAREARRRVTMPSMPRPSRNAACVAKPAHLKAGGIGCFGDAREIHPGRDVLHADVDERIVVRALLEVAAKRAVVRCG